MMTVLMKKIVLDYVDGCNDFGGNNDVGGSDYIDICDNVDNGDNS